MKLNKSQQQVIESDFSILNIAGPGSGKTSTMIEKTLHTVDDVEELNGFLIVTFTNNAAKTIIERIEKKFSTTLDVRALYIGTFHAMFYKILKENITELNIFGFKNDTLKILLPNEDADIFFTYFDEYFDFALLKISRKEFDELIEGIFNVTRTDIYYAISNSINKAPNDYMKIEEDVISYLLYKNENVGEEQLEKIKLILRDYFNMKINNNLMSFSDILLFMYLVLRNNKEVKNKVKQQFNYIFVDEFQDTNPIQSEILKLIFNNNFFVVGDPYQSIYKFLGADIKNIIEMAYDENINTIQLTVNYRSTKNIVQFTNDLVEQFTLKVPNWIPCSSGNTEFKNEDISIYEYADQETTIYNEMVKEMRNGVLGKEICVISRTNFESIYLEKKLLQNNIPFKKLSGKGFYETKEVITYLSIVKFLIDAKDVFSFKNFGGYYPKLGKTSITKIINGFIVNGKQKNYDFDITYHIKEKFPKNKALQGFVNLFENRNISYKLLEEIEQTMGLDSQLIKRGSTSAAQETIKENIKIIKKEMKDLLVSDSIEVIQDYIESISFNNKKDEVDKNNYVNITTAHSAKGMEWEVVYILNASDDNFPSSKNSFKEDAMEEEKRLFYVAVSRAKRKLSLLSSSVINSFVKPLKNEKYINIIKNENFGSFTNNRFY